MAGTKTRAIVLETELPGPNSRALMARRKAAVARGPFHSTPVFVESASGALLFDVDGNTLIDLAAGIGVVNAGHSPEAVVEAVGDQALRALHLGFNVTPYEPYVALCEALNRLAPGAFAKKSFLANSGAEAVENAVKIARAATGRPAVIAFEHAFHGRTFMAMAMTAKEKPYKAGFGPFSPEVRRAPVPYSYRGVDVDAAFAGFAATAAKDVAAVIIEPVMGEGGFLPMPPEFLKKLSEWCTANGSVLIADEIQSGFGRTGTLFASEQLGFAPDLIVTAKGLGGGLPISAVTGRAELMDAPGDGGIGGTFGGNPVCCAAALAVIDAFEKGGLLKSANRVGKLLEQRLSAWAKKYPVVGEARGLGAMRAIELVKGGDKTPHPDAAKALVKHCYERGVVTLTAGTFGNCLRFLPPLVITDEQLGEALDVVETGLDALKDLP